MPPFYLTRARGTSIMRGVMNERIPDLEAARDVLRQEGARISELADRIGTPFRQAAECISRCAGQVVLTGLGKAGIIARKISGTLASTGTPSIFLHPVEALHGDLGRLTEKDVVVALSHSGATEEILRVLNHSKARRAALIAVTGVPESPLAGHADIVLDYGPVEEACPLGLAPTVSTSCMLAMGDALALTVMEMRGFDSEQYAAFHPGGSLGRSLLKVSQVMSFRPGEHLNLVSDDLALGEALVRAEATERRSGAMLLVDGSGRLTGILTDADLRRKLIAARAEGGADIWSRPVSEIMTRDPKHVHTDDLASEALAILNEYRIDELPVLDEAGRAQGIIDVQDLLGIKTVADGQD